MTQAAGYTLDLYCDNDGCDNGEYGCRRNDQYFAETGAEARKMARKAGWKVAKPGSNDKDICPKCRARKTKR